MATDTIAEIDRLKAALDDLHPLPPDAVGRVEQKLRIEWNYHSNAIEGNSLTLGETRSLILHDFTARGKPMRDHLDIKGHDDAVKTIEEAVREDEPLNQAFIRNLHQVLLKESYEMPAETPDGHRTMRPISVGEYKKTPNNVLTRMGEMHYFAPPEQVHPMMGDLIDWYRAKEAEGEHPIIIGAAFHYRFVQIHPFDDGNGRMARLLMNLILMRHGYTIAMVQRDGRDQYIDEIEQAQATGSLAGFIAYIAECCRYSLELNLRAARGESIEDPDDIDGEIALFKSSIAAASGEGALVQVHELVEEVVLPLFWYFKQKATEFTKYFYTSDIQEGEVSAVSADGETITESASSPERLRMLPHTARSLRFRFQVGLYDFQAGHRSLFLSVVRTGRGKWSFVLRAGDTRPNEHIATAIYNCDDLDKLKKGVDDVVRSLMTVLQQWSNEAGRTQGDASN